MNRSLNIAAVITASLIIIIVLNWKSVCRVLEAFVKAFESVAEGSPLILSILGSALVLGVLLGVLHLWKRGGGQRPGPPPGMM